MQSTNKKTNGEFYLKPCKDGDSKYMELWYRSDIINYQIGYVPN